MTNQDFENSESENLNLMVFVKKMDALENQFLDWFETAANLEAWHVELNLEIKLRDLRMSNKTILEHSMFHQKTKWTSSWFLKF